MTQNLQKLSYLVWELRFLSLASQVAHWRVFGPTSYSDHLLFGRIYEKLNDLLDPLAERLTAFSEFQDERYVDPLEQAQYVYLRTKELTPALQESLLDANLAASFFYKHLLSLTTKLKSLSSDIKSEGYLTYGLDDMLATTSNELETLVYFLERRSQMIGNSYQGPSPVPASPTQEVEEVEVDSPSGIMQFPPLAPALVFGPHGSE